MEGFQCGPESQPEKQTGCSGPTKKAVVVSLAIVCVLAAVAIATSLLVVMSVKKTHSKLYHVQMTEDERLTIYDVETGVWKFICSSPGDEAVAQLGCEQMGFVRVINHTVRGIQARNHKQSAQFYCVAQQHLPLAGKLQEILFPCFCLSGQALALQCQDCGRRRLLSDRIVGGEASDLGRWPWQVSLHFDGGPMCGGSLIAEVWVVTAAHCFPGRNRFTNRWTVFGGSVNQLSAGVQNSGVQTPVQAVVYHANYQPFNDPNSEDNSNDIALLRLGRPLNFSDYIQPLCLPALGQELVDGALCTATGWGNTGYNGQLSNVLREVEVPILSNALCNSPAFYNHQITRKMFCAGYSEGGFDTCQGDSGGPLMCQDDLSNRTRWRLCGIVSWGTGCALARKPGVYCRVTEYQRWLYRAMKEYRNSNGIHSMS